MNRQRLVVTSMLVGSIVIAACSGEDSASTNTKQAFTGVPSSDAGSTSTGSTTDSGLPPGPTCPATPSFAVCSDGQVVAILHASSQAEIVLSQSVLNRLSDAAVKAFAQRMITDHTADDANVMAVAKAQGITSVENGLSTQITDEANDEVKTMSSESGSELDQDYIQHEVLDHFQDLGVADHLIAPSVQNAALAQAAATSRAIVAEHEIIAISTVSGLEGSCGGHETDQ